jgi:tripartite-type tricarboxylate transporter receptor subunit TctC
MPTIAESGVPGYEAVIWYGVWGPKGLPKEIVARWNTEVRNAIKQPDFKERLLGDAIDPADAPPEVFRDMIRRDVAKWSKVVKAANVKVIQ